ncbi:TetR/AcrR family transcriptional regulator [Bordetella genomosp. 13]|uniref:TetR/AcrR family transcriptional regulator n=1 Tax=Bordetella genomosp. 13 TaxID=463040 RepID=UPI0011A925F0|nr:TetR/AcrR family transcriptional regulator [Bordetella genomosp. 13]
MKKDLEAAAGFGTSTPERILQAAERLFSERGVDGVSLREITAAAQVNSAAAHYHFGSKEEVLKELFAVRARPIAERRVELLGQLKRNRQGRPVLEDVLRAFLWPALDALNTPEGLAFTLLRARMAFEREEVRREVLANAFDASSRLAMDELAKALPKLPVTELRWRFHFLLGAMVYTMAVPGRLESITEGGIDTRDATTALEQLVRYAAAGFRAP